MFSFQRKMLPRKLFAYSAESMENALRDIRENNIPVATACKRYNVPRSSVRNRLAGRTHDNCRRVGPTCALGPEIEKKISVVDFGNGEPGFSDQQRCLVLFSSKADGGVQYSVTFIR